MLKLCVWTLQFYGKSNSTIESHHQMSQLTTFISIINKRIYIFVTIIFIFIYSRKKPITSKTTNKIFIKINCHFGLISNPPFRTYLLCMQFFIIQARVLPQNCSSFNFFFYQILEHRFRILQSFERHLC